MNDQKRNPVAIPAVNCVDPIASAKELTPLIRAHADETERGRRLAAPVVDALRSARLFTMGLPASLGGAETRSLQRCAQLKRLPMRMARPAGM
jgi:hypothetical protein